MQNRIQSVVIIGAGNVATHLARNLSKLITVLGIASKNHQTAKQLAEEIQCVHIKDLTQIPACDLVLICTSDSSIATVVNSIPKDMNIAYTSGSFELGTITSHNHIGVFYPLQTFSKEKEITLSDVPFFIEAKEQVLADQLYELASKLSNNVSFANSEVRKKLHLAAVFSNNFINHLTYIAFNYLDSQNLDKKHLSPLLRETFKKNMTASPKDNQTGPARRNDKIILEEHLDMLSGYPQKIYQIISESIIDTYSQKNNE